MPYDPALEPAAPPRTPATAVASIVVSAIGCCVPYVGIVGVILGAIGLMQSLARRAGAVASVIGMLLGLITALPWVLLTAAFLLPAFPGTEPIRRIASLGFAVMIAEEIGELARANAGEYPPPGSDFQSLISPDDIPPFIWRGVFRSTDQPQFLLVYESLDPPYRPTWIMLNPDIAAAAQIPMIGFENDQIELVSRGEAVRIIGDAHLFTTDGRPWRLTGPVP